MKAGHSSALGSNENVNVLLSFETDNLTVLQNPFNIYHHFLQGKEASYLKQIILAYTKKWYNCLQTYLMKMLLFAISCQYNGFPCTGNTILKKSNALFTMRMYMLPLPLKYKG